MDQFIVVYVVSTVVALAVLYLLIRIGVQHGTRAAMREHEMWLRDGSLDQAMDAHVEKLAQRAATAHHERLVAQREQS